MKLYLLVLAGLVLLLACTKPSQDIEPAVQDTSQPRVETLDITIIGRDSAIVSGNVTANGSSPVMARGVVWDTLVSPTIALSTKTVNGNGLGPFTAGLSKLKVGVVYYVRAYATNTTSTSYGLQKTVTTQPATPTVITVNITGVTSDSAVVSGLTADDGGASITARGFVWDTLRDPVLGNSNVILCGSGIGNFTGVVKPLLTAKRHYVRAFATNLAGTAYGDNLTFDPPFQNNRVFNLYSTRPTDSSYGTYFMSTANNYRLSFVVAEDLVLPPGVHCFVKFTNVSGVSNAEVNGSTKPVYTNDTLRITSTRVRLQVLTFYDSLGVLQQSNCTYEVRIGGKAVSPGPSYHHVFSLTPLFTTTSFWNTLKTLTQFSQPYLQ